MCAGLSHLSILWDRKRLKNSDGETYEAKLILVSGAPDYYFPLMREKISSTSTRISTPLLCDDYKKIVEITLKFLGSELPAEKKFAWKKVRFMAWSLCSMKAFAFSSEMDCSKEIIKKLQCFTLFHVTIYIPQFLTSSIGSDAAINDLSLHKKLQKF